MRMHILDAHGFQVAMGVGEDRDKAFEEGLKMAEQLGLKREGLWGLPEEQEERIFRIHEQFWLMRSGIDGVTLLVHEGKEAPVAKDFHKHGTPIPEGIWLSAVCNASKIGESLGRYHQAEAFHRGVVVHTTDPLGHKLAAAGLRPQASKLLEANEKGLLAKFADLFK